MRALCILGLCLLTLAACADRRGQLSQQRPPVGGWTDPSGSNTLYAWWITSDLPVSTTLLINDTNPWIDRVAGRLLRASNGANTPTNGSLGVYMGTAFGGLTNTPTSQGSNSTYCIIFRPTGIAGGGNPATALAGPYDLGDATQGATPGGFSIDVPTSVLYWGTKFVSGPAISGTLTDNTTYDVIAVQSASSLKINTNGVESASLTKLPPLTGWPWRYVGNDYISAANTFPGYVKEVLIWSNSFSSVQLSNVHYYATNTYQYAP